MRVTIREYLHAINVLDREIDVHMDTGAGYVVCPPIKFTPAAEQRFGYILDSQDLYVDVEQYADNIMCDSDKAYDDYDKGEGIIPDAIFLLNALAGYCGDYNALWFEGEDAKLI